MYRIRENFKTDKTQELLSSYIILIYFRRKHTGISTRNINENAKRRYPRIYIYNIRSHKTFIIYFVINNKVTIFKQAFL